MIGPGVHCVTPIYDEKIPERVVFDFCSGHTPVVTQYDPKGDNMTDNMFRTADGKPDYNKYRGQRGSVDFEGLSVSVIVQDARNRYGHLDLLVEPVEGDGARWLEHHRVNINPDAVAETPSTINKLDEIRALLSGINIK